MNADFILQQDRKQSITDAMAQRSRDSIKRFDALEKIAGTVGWDSDAAPEVKAKAAQELKTLFNDTRPTEKVAGEYCRVDKEHGLLGVHASGLVLICGDKRCSYQQPIALGDEQ